jgi:hypothetical protein
VKYNTRQPCTILRAPVCCMPLCFHAASFLFDLLLNLALPVCFCMCSSRLPPGFFFQPTAAAGESCVCLQWCLWQACQTSIACCCVWSSRATPCNSMDHCQEYNLHPIMQHASCHACLLIISISEASKVNHVKAYAATWLYLPAITHCPPAGL